MNVWNHKVHERRNGSYLFGRIHSHPLVPLPCPHSSSTGSKIFIKKWMTIFNTNSSIWVVRYQILDKLLECGTPNWGGCLLNQFIIWSYKRMVVRGELGGGDGLNKWCDWGVHLWWARVLFGSVESLYHPCESNVTLYMN